MATIDRLVTEFNEDVAIFRDAGAGTAFLRRSTASASELAEKRATEAQRGRERLEHARSATNALLFNIAANALLPVMTEFLSGYTLHHLIQVMLRDGYGSLRYDDAMLAVDELTGLRPCRIAHPGRGTAGAASAAVRGDPASSGCLGDGMEAAIDCLQDAPGAAGQRRTRRRQHHPHARAATGRGAGRPCTNRSRCWKCYLHRHPDFDGAVLERTQAAGRRAGSVRHLGRSHRTGKV